MPAVTVLTELVDDARAAVRRALRSGELVRESCRFCGAVHNIDAHHEDYSNPLEVWWLCRSCHKRRHAELNEYYGGDERMIEYHFTGMSFL